MGLFSGMQLNSFEDLLVEQLQDLYDAEKQLVKALPLMAEAAHSPSLRAAFEEHFRQTNLHVSRVERALQALGKSPQSKTCEAMKGLVAEGSEIIKGKGDPDVKDAALIAAAQRVEHYEIAGYGCARAFALQLGKKAEAQILEQTLEEEMTTDKRLTSLAEETINPKATATA